MLSKADFKDQTTDLINSPAFQQIKQKHFSDVVDENHHQYVHLVMQGGGTLGIALVGYIYMLEKAGIRFLKLGGTSVGALTAAFMAASDYIDARKSDVLLEHLAQLDLLSLQDDPETVAKFTGVIETIRGDDASSWLIARMFSKFYNLSVAGDLLEMLKDKWGVLSGNALEQWLEKVFSGWGVATCADLYKLRKPGKNNQLYFRSSSNENNAKFSQQNYADNEEIFLIAADVTTETKAIFPKHAGLYWENPNMISPAKLVRASVSVPIIFEPMVVKNIPSSVENKLIWKEELKYAANLPEEVRFVDGGIISNFPIDLFDEQNPSAPIFGVKLGLDRSHNNDMNGLLDYVRCMFDTARKTYDYEFLRQNPKFEEVIQVVEVDGFDWLKFALSDEEKLKLFRRGAEAALDFLTRFDWESWRARWGSE